MRRVRGLVIRISIVHRMHSCRAQITTKHLPATVQYQPLCLRNIGNSWPIREGNTWHTAEFPLGGFAPVALLADALLSWQVQANGRACTCKETQKIHRPR